MSKKRYRLAEIMAKLRAPLAARVWRDECGGTSVAQVKRLKE